ncbi:MAG: tRNA 2-thiouridine(34) synthase MnmA [Spirochaetes bacterium]|nr:tRNA 2-thiouridine(34) synthase MnmA [Spirochaetota bacterium]
MKGKVMVAMSGGVDSSAAAYLVKQSGYDAAGLTMILDTRQDKEEKSGEIIRDIEDARKVCEIIGIPHYVEDLSSEIENLVVKPFIEEYQRGRTPNPCVICNKTIKFGLFMDKAKAYGYDIVASGHYTRKLLNNGKYFIRSGIDTEKDQSYFLYMLTGEVLEHVIFPIGDYTKDEIRSMAEKENFPLSHRRESQDICFFHGGSSTEFFNSRNLSGQPGNIVDMEGNVIGAHKGIIFYTIGQRRGLGISSPDPLYVVGIDPGKNTIIAGHKRYLKSGKLSAVLLNFNSDEKEGRAFGKIRYAHKPARCRYKITDSEIEVIFDELQEAITPGQSIVLYENDLLLGGGIINQVTDSGQA